MFTLTDYEDSQKAKLKLIKDWKEIVNQVDAIMIIRLSGSEHQKLWNFENPSDDFGNIYYQNSMLMGLASLLDWK